MPTPPPPPFDSSGLRDAAVERVMLELTAYVDARFAEVGDRLRKLEQHLAAQEKLGTMGLAPPEGPRRLSNGTDPSEEVEPLPWCFAKLVNDHLGCSADVEHGVCAVTPDALAAASDPGAADRTSTCDGTEDADREGGAVALSVGDAAMEPTLSVSSAGDAARPYSGGNLPLDAMGASEGTGSTNLCRSMGTGTLTRGSLSVGGMSELKSTFGDDQPYELQKSIWDVSLLICCRHINRADSALIVFLLLLNIMAQGIFLGIVYYIFMEEKFNDGLLGRLLEWRIHYGHHIDYYDPFTFSSLTERVCQPKMHAAEMSTRIAGLVEAMHTFLAKGNAVFNGQSLLVAALLCWTLTIMREVTQVWNISRAARCLPRGERRIVQPRDDKRGVACRLVAISSARKAWWDAIVALRLVCAVALWVMGCRFLALYSITPEAVLLDVVALEVVFHVDEAVFTLAPRSVCEILERLDPLKARPQRCRRGRTDVRPVFLTAVVVCTLLLCQGLIITPLVEKVSLANATVCGGAQDFVFSIDPMSVVHYQRSKPKELAAPSFEVVRQLLFERPDASLPALRRPAVELLRGVSTAAASVALQAASGETCADVLTGGPSHQGFISIVAACAARNGAPVLPETPTCRDLAPSCGACAMTRALCPATCGCDDPVGRLLAAGADQGCPAACAKAPAYADKLSALPCDERSPEELRSDEVWLAWVGQVDALLLGAAPLDSGPCGGGNCSVAMLREGCNIIPLWRRSMHTDLCRGDWFVGQLPVLSRPLAPYCPQTCGCRHSGFAADEKTANGCPDRCAADQARV